jgi:hypothetical protein
MNCSLLGKFSKLVGYKDVMSEVAKAKNKRSVYKMGKQLLACQKKMRQKEGSSSKRKLRLLF